MVLHSCAVVFHNSQCGFGCCEEITTGKRTRENKDMINKSQKLASSFGLALSKYLTPLLLAGPDVERKHFGLSFILVRGSKTKKSN